jgi:hypothetical protein
MCMGRVFGYGTEMLYCYSAGWAERRSMHTFGGCVIDCAPLWHPVKQWLQIAAADGKILVTRKRR